MSTTEMLAQTRSSSLTRVWIPIGAVLFILALIGSAAVVPQLRPLHFFQALVYVAIIILARRDSVWALGAAVAISLYWNGLQLFVTHNFQTGAKLFWLFLHTGQVRRFDTMMVTIGGIGHFILILSCLFAAALSPKTGSKKWWEFLGGAVACLAYFALIVFLLLPRG